MYHRITLLFELHTTRVVTTILNCATIHKDAILLGYSREWETFLPAMGVFDKIFRHLNAHWVKADQAVVLSQKGLAIWHKNVLAPLLSPLIASVAQRYREMRQRHCAFDASAVKSAVESLSQDPSPIPYQQLEQTLMEETFLHYSTNSSGKCLSASAMSPAFLDQLHGIDQLETAVCQQFGLTARTRWNILALVEKHLLASRLREMEDAVLPLLQEGRYPQLVTVIGIIKRTESGSLPAVMASFEQFVVLKLGHAIELLARSTVSPQQIYQLYCPLLLDFHARFSELVARYFDPDTTPGFRTHLLSAFRKIINRNQVTSTGLSSARLIARYLDISLRTPLPPASAANAGDDPSATLKSTVHGIVNELFPLLEAKDLFLECYAADLATRIIYRQSVSPELERLIQNDLKHQTSDSLVEPASRLFLDLYESASFQESFAKHLRSQRTQANALDFNLLIISYGQWPIPLSPVCFSTAHFPVLHSFESTLTAHYAKLHPGKKLSMLHHYARGHLASNYTPDKAYTLICSGTQIAVLLLFNNHRVRSLENLLSATQLPENEVALALRTLLSASLLLAEPPVTPLTPLSSQHAFRLNPNFAHSESRIRISDLIPIKSKADRLTDQNYLMAAIIRIIKPLGTLPYSRLVETLLQFVKMRLTPDTQLIGAALTALVDRKMISYNLTEHTYSYLP